MALPKIDQPLFPITIPSTGQKTKFRPFTVKEEKILLIAQESQDAEQMVLAFKQIVENCVQDVNVSSLATFDFDFLLFQIRAKSVGEVINFSIADPETEEEIKLSADISKIEVKVDPKLKVVELNDRYKLLMKYPNFEESLAVEQGGDIDQRFKLLLSCVEKLIDTTEEDKVYDFDDTTEEEKVEFFESLRSISGIKSFFESIPSVKLQVPYKTKSGEERVHVISGFQSFFI